MMEPDCHKKNYMNLKEDGKKLVFFLLLKLCLLSATNTSPLVSSEFELWGSGNLQLLTIKV